MDMLESRSKFIKAANVAHFKDVLKTETDPGKRKVLQELLRDEVWGRPRPEKGAAVDPE
jgi:hypothetical protein